MNLRKKLNETRIRRRIKVRSRIGGTKTKPRLSVFRSHYYTYVQLIDDANGKTIASASSKEIKNKMPKTTSAAEVGQMIAERAKKLGVTNAVFDRGSYRYHGRVRVLVEAARKAGLKI
jgi:large subunit ribosomal protein L18